MPPGSLDLYPPTLAFRMGYVNGAGPSVIDGTTTGNGKQIGKDAAAQFVASGNDIAKGESIRTIEKTTLIGKSHKAHGL